MLAEFWKGFCATINNAAPTIVEPSQEPKGVYYVRLPNGELMKEFAEFPRRRLVADVPSLVRLTEDMSAANSSRKLFVADGEIRCLIDDHKPACAVEEVQMPLTKTPEFEWLFKVLGRNSSPGVYHYTHSELMLLFRTTLRDAIDPAIRSKFQSFRVTSNTDVRSETTNSKASLGREVEQAAMLGDEDIPEYFDIECSMTRQFPDSKHTFRVYVTVDHERDSQFILTPSHRHYDEALNEEWSRIEIVLNAQPWSNGAKPVFVRGSA